MDVGLSGPGSRPPVVPGGHQQRPGGVNLARQQGPPFLRGRGAYIMNCHSAPSSPSAGRGSGLNLGGTGAGSGNSLKPPEGGNAPAIRSSSGAKEIILFWVQNKLQDYPISITNFSTCWNDGLAFCALIHAFYPEAFDWSSLRPENRRYNFTLAFQAAEELADIYPLLEVDDMVRFRDGRSPPKRSPSPANQKAVVQPSAVALAVLEEAKEEKNSFAKKKMSCPPMKFTGQQSVLNPAGKASPAEYSSPAGYSRPAGNANPVKEKTSPIEEKTNETAVRKISSFEMQLSPTRTDKSNPAESTKSNSPTESIKSRDRPKHLEKKL